MHERGNKSRVCCVQLDVNPLQTFLKYHIAALRKGTATELEVLLVQLVTSQLCHTDTDLISPFSASAWWWASTA